MKLSHKYMKDLHYLPPDVKIDARFLSLCKATSGSSGLVQAYTSHFYRKGGVQLRVDKALSDDLLLSDFKNPDLAALLWPSHTVEFYFEDPAIPTAIIGRYDIHTILAQFEGLDIPDAEPGDRLMVLIEGDDGRGNTLVTKPSKHEEILIGRSVPADPGAMPLAPGENEDLLNLTTLCLKVLAYCSVPKFQFQEPGQITRRMGGKVGFKGRPSRPSKRVSYMPSIVTLGKPTNPSEPNGKHVSPHNRRGHLRYYQSDRYVNRKGTWDFIPPVRIHGGVEAIKQIKVTA